MGIVDTIKGFVGTTEPAETYDYRCTECDSEFESRSENSYWASCSECGSDDVEPVE